VAIWAKMVLYLRPLAAVMQTKEQARPRRQLHPYGWADCPVAGLLSGLREAPWHIQRNSLLPATERRVRLSYLRLRGIKGVVSSQRLLLTFSVCAGSIHVLELVGSQNRATNSEFQWCSASSSSSSSSSSI